MHQICEELEALERVTECSRVRIWQSGVVRSYAWIRLHHASLSEVGNYSFTLWPTLGVQNELLVLSRIASKKLYANHVDVIRSLKEQSGLDLRTLEHDP